MAGEPPRSQVSKQKKVVSSRKRVRYLQLAREYEVSRQTVMVPYREILILNRYKQCIKQKKLYTENVDDKISVHFFYIGD